MTLSPNCSAASDSDSESDAGSEIKTPAFSPITSEEDTPNISPQVTSEVLGLPIAIGILNQQYYTLTLCSDR